MLLFNTNPLYYIVFTEKIKIKRFNRKGNTMKFIKIPAFAIVLLLLMQIVSKAFIAIDSSDIENIYGFYAEPKNSLIWS